MKILYIEDDPNSERIVSMFVRMAGHKIISARDPRSGLKLAYRENPDLIMMDYQLPGFNGLQAVDLIKTTQRLASTPVIIVTAAASESDKRRFIEAGCDGVIPKPVDRHQMEAEIERVYRKSQYSESGS